MGQPAGKFVKSDIQEKPLLHKTLKMAFYLGLMTVTLLIGTAINAGRPVLGEIACPASASYRIGAGPRVSPPNGLYPLALPVEIRTHTDPCRVLVPGQCLIEAGANCTLSFSQGKAGEFLLRIEKGPAIYLIETSATLQVQTTPRGPWGFAGSATTGHKVHHLGMVEVTPNGQTLWVNLQGELKVLEEKTLERPVPAMHSLRFGRGQGAEIAPLLGGDDAQGEGKGPRTPDRIPLTLESWTIASTSPPSLHATAMARLKGCTPRHPHDMGPIAPNQLDENR